MDNSLWRRLDSLSRHLSRQPEANGVLHTSIILGEKPKQSESEPVIIGGMVLDIHATSYTHPNPRTTTPGKVEYVMGGVARNVAECMSKLGAKPFMISAVGLDTAGDLLLEYWKSAGLSTEGIQKRHGIGTAVVCNLFDDKGELAAAVASLETIEKYLSKEWIHLFECRISSAPLLMIDANVEPCSLEASCQIAAQSGLPVWFEPVSVAKSRRVATIVNYVTFTSPNEDELIAMANSLSCGDEFAPIRKATDGSRWSICSLFKMLKPAIWVLIEKGIKCVIVTLGSDGVFLCSRGGPAFMKDGFKNKFSIFGEQLHEIITSNCPSDLFVGVESESSSNLYAVHLPALPTSIMKLTGAGDCLVGGTLASLCAGLNVIQSVAVGIAAAKAAVQVEVNVPSKYCLATIAADARQVYSGAKVVFHQSMV